MTEASGPPQGDAVAGLIAQVGKIGRRLEEVDGDVDGLREQVGELAGLVRDLAEREEVETRGERATWWPDLRAGEERTTALRLLGAWVDEVLRDRHPDAYKGLQTCWYLHPEVLDEVTALRAAWYGAYRDKAASATAAIEWHDRWLPACMTRCKAAIKARGCDKGGHDTTATKTEPFYDSGEFEAFTKAAPKSL